MGARRNNFGAERGRKITVIAILRDWKRKNKQQKKTKKKQTKQTNKQTNTPTHAKRLQPASFKILILVKQKPFIMVNEDVYGANSA